MAGLIALLFMASFLGPMVAHVEAETIAVYRDANLDLSLSVALGGDMTTTQTNLIDLDLAVGMAFDTADLENIIDLDLGVSTWDNLHTSMHVNVIGLILDLSMGGPYNLIMLWDPYDQPKLTGKNYTYNCYVGLQGIPQELHIVIRFEGSFVAEKDSNSTGQFQFWAVVGSPGMHVWTFTLFEDGEQVGIIWKSTDYVDGGPPDPEEPEPPDIEFFTILDFFPIMAVFGVLAFVGNLLIGRIGILFGGIAALFITTALGTMPSWVIYFLILVTILVVVFKFKTGGSKVEVDGGGGA